MLDRGQVPPVRTETASPVPETETEAARAARELAEVVEETRVAAREWGVRPDHLEGRFVSALLGTMGWLGRLVQAASADMRAAAREHRDAASAELERLRVANDMAANAVERARVAVAGSEVQRERLIGRFVEAAVPQLVEKIAEAVVLRERRYNRKVQWGRAAGVAAVAGGLLLSGYVWGGRDAGAGADAAAAAAVLERVRQCRANPIKDGRTGEAYCPLKQLLPGS